MATAKANITIGGKKIDPYNISVQQRCDRHHQFEIAVAVEKIEGANSLTIDNSINYIGQSTEINIQCADGNFKFKGLITSVHIDRTYTGDSLIIFAGYSPTYLLEDSVGTQSYEEKDLAGIANEILGTYPANLLNPNISPQYSTPIPYVVRYKETNYQFLSRLAAIYGEWFYYDGESLVFGKLPNPASVTVTLGKDLESFDYGVQVRPSKFEYQSYNYEENRMVTNASTGFKPGWLDNYGKKALDTADSIFPNTPTNPIAHDTREDALMKHLVEARKSSILSDTTFFKGQSTHAGIAVGARVRAKAINKVSGQNVPGVIGNFRITAVTHRLDANKNYRNNFEAIPLTVSAPPVDRSVFKPEAESQVAVVKDNNDPEALGRVRVQLKWQKGNEMTPWIRQTTNYASSDRGVYFVPEIGDEVYVDFEQGNPDRPYMTGAYHHGKTKPEFFDADNNFKSIKTRSGHTILFSDEAGGESITITDKNGNEIVIDTVENTMNVTALETINFSCKNMNFDVQENVNWNVGQNVSSEVGQSVSTNAGQNVSTNAGNSIESLASNTVDINGGASVDMNSGMNNNFSLAANGTASLSTQNSIATNTGAMSIKGGKGTRMYGKSVQVKGDTGVDIN